jgi:putative MATE family efflux protein
MTRGPVAGHLVRLTVPMFLGISSMIVASLLDAVYVGWIGTTELAAISFTFPVVMALTSVIMGLGIGAASLIARFAGSNDHATVRRLSTHTMILVSLAAVAGAALGLVYCRPIFALMGAEDPLLPLVIEYMSVWFLGFPLFAIPMVAGNIFRSVNRPRATGVIMTSGAAVQVIIAPLLMFGIPGMTEGIGFIGSAWAFVGSRLLTLLLAAWLVSRLKLLTAEGLAPSAILRSWGSILRIGIPSVLSNLIGPISIAIIIGLLAGHGEAVVASFGIASRIEMLATMILMAVSSSVGPFVGQNYGAQRFDRIDQALRISYRFSHVWGAFALLVLVVIGRWCVTRINDDPAVVDAAYLYLVMVPVSYGFFGASMAAASSFIALGHPLPTLIMSILRMLVLYVPVAVIANEYWGYAGVYAATAFANVTVGVVAVVWIRRLLIAKQAP